MPAACSVASGRHLPIECRRSTLWTMSQLSDRIAVVTGASAGIGLAIVKDLVANGARVVINARRAEKLKGLVAELGSTQVTGVVGDCAEQSVINEIMETARVKFGGGEREADLVVVNAGR